LWGIIIGYIRKKMISTEDYKINVENLALVKFTTVVNTRDIVDVLLNKLTDEELKLIKLLTTKLPMRSSMEDDDSYWDIVLGDNIIRMYLEDILKKYKIEYSVQDVTNLYYEKSKEFTSDEMESMGFSNVRDMEDSDIVDYFSDDYYEKIPNEVMTSEKFIELVQSVPLNIEQYELGDIHLINSEAEPGYRLLGRLGTFKNK
jgi:hypothetical protein